jgi:DNA polymerase-3 subunit gamma/tau
LTDEGERSRLATYAQAFDAEFLQLCYQIAIHGRDDLSLAPDEYAGFAMTLLRLFAFRPDSGSPGAQAVGPRPGAVAVAKSRPQPQAQPVVAAPAATAASAAADWHTIAASLALAGLPKQLAHHCELAELGDAQISLRLPPAHKSLLNTKAPQEKLQAELQAYFGRPMKLSIVVAEAEGQTPADRTRSEKRERQEQAIAAIEGDAFVRDVVDLFDASIDESTIKPV